jgi:hypothetical protein
MEYAFLPQGTQAESNELDRLQRLLAKQREVYQANPAAALALVAKEQAPEDPVGAEPATDKSEPAERANPQQSLELAAWTAVSRVLFNLDDFMTRE